MTLHPALIHFPIAFSLLETGLLLWYLKSKNDQWFKFSKVVFYSALILMIPPLITGLQDAGGIAPALEHARNHFLGAITFALIVVFRFCLMRFISPWPWLYFFSSLVQSAAVVMTAHWGGELVHG